jgi:hypothetical protein
MPLTVKGDKGSSDCCPSAGMASGSGHATIPGPLAPALELRGSPWINSSAQGLRKALRSRPHGLYVTQASALVRFSLFGYPHSANDSTGLAGRIGYPRTNAPASSTPPMNSARTTWRVDVKNSLPRGPGRPHQDHHILSRQCHHCFERGLPLRTATRARSCPGFGPMMIRWGSPLRSNPALLERLRREFHQV